MNMHALADVLTSVICRLAICANSRSIDDPAMLAFLFC